MSSYQVSRLIREMARQALDDPDQPVAVWWRLHTFIWPEHGCEFA